MDQAYEKTQRSLFWGQVYEKSLFRAQGYVVENPPPAPPVQNFHHEPKVDNNDLLLEVHNMGEMAVR